MGFFEKLKVKLKKTQKNVVNKVEKLVKRFKKIDEELFEEIEGVLIQADLGVNTALNIVGEMKKNVEARGITDADELIELFKRELKKIMKNSEKKWTFDKKPFVILVLGVNGVGKTTTIGKLAFQYRKKGYNVLLVAADTFRAAAIEQLEIWADRAKVDIYKKEMKYDPAAVCFESLQKALKKDYDIVLIDTAGRLHTQINLLDELKKVNKVIKKVIPDAPHETVLVLDATTGQNAISQTKTFSEALPITSFILTKLDGTAKGGIVISLYDQFKIPISYIGIGEQIDDLKPFCADDFIEALFSREK